MAKNGRMLYTQAVVYTVHVLASFKNTCVILTRMQALDERGGVYEVATAKRAHDVVVQVFDAGLFFLLIGPFLGTSNGLELVGGSRGVGGSP